ncbi:Hypothetical protein FKW44_011758, partial [Caligus rogercresseyi]
MTEDEIASTVSAIIESKYPRRKSLRRSSKIEEEEVTQIEIPQIKEAMPITLEIPSLDQRPELVG